MFTNASRDYSQAENIIHYPKLTSPLIKLFNAIVKSIIFTINLGPFKNFSSLENMIDLLQEIKHNK